MPIQFTYYIKYRSPVFRNEILMPSEGPLNSQYAIATPLVRLIPWIIHLTPMVNISFQIIGNQIEKNMKLPRKIP
jgi:hypothetical protein